MKMNMKRIFIFSALLFLLTFPVAGSAQDGMLSLIKEGLDPTFSGTTCSGIFEVHRGKDIKHLRGFRLYACQGRYTLTLEGKRGDVVTLFGRSGFGKENGFLVIRKTDDRKVWLIDFETLPEGNWVKRGPIDRSGGLHVYYQPAPNFSQKISSVKWGRWWNGSQPE
ncbi:exported hypothetical protein [Nitrospina gracilis 3/211]|uniref:Uncharacterized protein n=2 Tax=Nitrospinaceae TaxID=407032 RepID=M1ZAR4_NITG3|nr:exported hypothetical protein [Nitrospina gracilis 3/211]